MKHPYLEIKGWQSFQHYHDRRPPWIKLYVQLLDDLEFIGMSHRSQITLVKLWLLASRIGNPLPNNLPLLAGKIGERSIVVEPLIQAGFLIETDSKTASADASTNASKDASKVASIETPPDASAHARPRARERERKRERESTEQQLPTTTRRVFDALPEDRHRTAFLDVLERAPGKETFSARIERLAGVAPSVIPMATYPWDVIGDALEDLAQKAAPATQLPGYCRIVASRKSIAPASPGELSAASKLFIQQETARVA